MLTTSDLVLHEGASDWSGVSRIQGRKFPLRSVHSLGGEGFFI